MGKTILTTLFLFIGVFLFGQTIYVKEGGTGDGSSWINASGDLADALSKSTFGRDIWLAEGKYTPVSCSTCGQAERNTPFVLTSGAKIYGGFGGWESDLNERKPDVFKSILSGDIDGDNTLANNSYTIIFTENVSNQTLVDGVTISDGNADFPDAAFGDRHNSGAAWFNKSGLPGDASHPVVKNVIFKNNRANGFGAAFYSNGSFGASNAPVFENVVFENNIAEEEGGAFYGNGSFGGLCNPEFRNCTFKKNKAVHDGGGAFSLTGAEQGVGNAIFEDCLFEENEAGFSGGAIHSFGKTGQSNSILRRCTFLLNRAAEGGAIYSDGSFSGYSVPVFEECYFEKNEATGSGGVFYGNGIFQGVSSPVFKTCQFFQNKALELHGGAVANLGSENGIANANFEDCIFEENEALLNGGAIFNFGLKGHSNPVLKRCTFRKNVAREGAGMYSDASFGGECNPDVTDCNFFENHAGGDGGAVYNLSASDGLCQGKYERCVFEKNTCVNAGGAVLNNGATGGSCVPAFTNCSFIENVTENYGAAMYNIGNGGLSNPTINNCLFAKNHALSSAGAIYNLGSNSGESSPRITNCTFFGNKAIVGSTIYCNAENEMGLSAPLISNCIFYGNSAPTGRLFRLIYGKPTVEFCLFDIDSCEVLNNGLNGEVNCGNGLIFSDELVFEDTLAGNFRLKSTASIIDAGNSQATQTANIQQDLDGNPRIINSVVDYGAYEYMGGGVIAPTITGHPSNQEACTGENITLSIAASGNSALNYQWRKDGANISGAVASTYTILGATLADAASYSCVVSNSAGSIESAWAVISVNETVNFTLDLSVTDTNVCEGNEVEISAVLQNGGTAPQYEWSLNGTPLAGQSNASIKVIANTNTEEYRCQATSSEKCPDNPTQFAVSVVRGQEVVVPTLSIMDPDSICIDEPVIFSANQTFGGVSPTYNWLVNGVATGDVMDTFSSLGLEEGDVVKCEMRSSEKCPDKEVVFSNEVDIHYKNCIVATDNLFELGTVSVFPNPTSEDINVAFEKQYSEMLISIFNSQGQLVFENMIPSGVSNFKINATEFPNGIYFLQLKNEEDFGSTRISKF